MQPRYLLGLTVIFAFILLILFFDDQPIKQNVSDENRTIVPHISTRLLIPVRETPTITLYGEITPELQTTLSVPVEGKITYLSSNLYSGRTFSKDEVLLTIEDTPYRFALADAHQQHAAAKLALLQEQNEAEQARYDRNALNPSQSPASPLQLRTPHLEVAQKTHETTKEALKLAHTNLTYTTLKAPFDGVVIQRDVNPYETLSAGHPIATLYGTKSAEIPLHLTLEQWEMLPEHLHEMNATLHSLESSQTWQASPLRASHHIDPESRMRTLYLKVASPLTKGLFFGRFIRATLYGKTQNTLLKIPLSAITKRQEIWYVDHTDHLRRLPIHPLFYKASWCYIQAPEHLSYPLQVALAPNSTFRHGLYVMPTLKD